ncbi:MAG TPA: winged helix-turn-helix transcriptional regulator [Firmicutes bacterium]|nr:winged helix-turn-helix transcriptional regulator [Bacillota bacterium]
MDDLVRAFKALGDENRLRILAELNKGSCGVCRLAKALDMPQPTISHHLKILREADLVLGEKEGPLVHCRVNHEGFKRRGIDLAMVLKEVAESR